jgi:hypothetical protein
MEIIELHIDEYAYSTFVSDFINSCNMNDNDIIDMLCLIADI